MPGPARAGPGSTASVGGELRLHFDFGSHAADGEVLAGLEGGGYAVQRGYEDRDGGAPGLGDQRDGRQRQQDRTDSGVRGRQTLGAVGRRLRRGHGSLSDRVQRLELVDEFVHVVVDLVVDALEGEIGRFVLLLLSSAHGFPFQHRQECLCHICAGVIGTPARRLTGQLLSHAALRSRHTPRSRRTGRTGRLAGRGGLTATRLLSLGGTGRPTADHASAIVVCTCPPMPYSSPAMATVARAKSWNCAVGDSFSVSTRYQMRPSTTQVKPPSAVAARLKARFGMPELMCTPPLSSEPET